MDKATSMFEDIDFDFDFDDPAQRTVSKYVTGNKFSEILSKFNRSSFSIFHANIRSMNKNFDNLLSLINKPSPHPLSIIGLSETWLKDDSNLPYFIDSYNFIHKNRQDKLGGGVALFLHKDLNYIVLDEISIL